MTKKETQTTVATAAVNTQSEINSNSAYLNIVQPYPLNSADYFSQIQKWQSLPKVELHRHLECSIRPQTLLNLAEKKLNKKIDLDYLKNNFLILKPMTDLSTVLKKFLNTQDLITSEDILTQITQECIEDAYHEGIKILELRWAPTFIQLNHPHLSFEKILNAIRKGKQNCSHLPIAVGFIGIIQRTLGLNTAHEVTDFILSNKNDFIGIDLADDELHAPAISFVEVFKKAQQANLPITIHAGEALDPRSIQNVIDAVTILGARRIGHGLQIIHDEKAMNFIKNEKIPLELCPTSNWITGAISKLNEHPFHKLFKKNILCTINSDDPGVFGINLLNEYVVLSDLFQFNENDFKKFNEIAFENSFIPYSEKSKVWTCN